MAVLHLTDNAKVKFRKNHRNTFGLNYGLPINGGTCPGATLGPGGCLNVKTGGKRATCYMAKVVQIYKGVGNKLQENTDLLRDKSYEEMLDTLTSTFEEFKRKNKGEDLFFRNTYSGDAFSMDFAKALRDSCKKFPEIKFWMYTRSHNYVELLCEAENIAVYISVDPSNYIEGYKVYDKLIDKKNVGLAWMGDPPVGGHKFITCPETSGKIKNTEDMGACAKCRLCLNYNSKIKLRNIGFNIH